MKYGIYFKNNHSKYWRLKTITLSSEQAEQQADLLVQNFHPDKFVIVEIADSLPIRAELLELEMRFEYPPIYQRNYTKIQAV